MRKPGMRKPARWALLAVVVATLASGCVLKPNLPNPPESSSAPASSAAPASASPLPTNPSSRPTQPVPAVKPEGFVDPPPGSGLGRYRSQRLAWQDCGSGFQCATVRAPLDYRKPDEQAITLSVRRKPASQGPRLGSLFINPGGPGGSGFDYVEYFEAKNLERYDIVGWDPRGVARSTPVKCFNGDQLDAYFARDGSPDNPQEAAELLRAERDFGASCLQQSGPLLQHISTPDTARDLDLLRSLVGDRKLTYFGSSYGTAIGARYAELFPRNVGRMVLDGAVDLSDNSEVSQTQGFERTLGDFAAWCAANRCLLGTSKQEVLNAIATLWRQLDANPLPGGRRLLTQELAVDGVVRVLYEPASSWKYLQQALEMAIVERDGRYLLYLADLLHERDDNGTFGQSNFAFPAIRCLDSQDTSVVKAEKKAAQDKKKTPTFGVATGPDFVCPMWPVAPAPKPPAIDGNGAPPIIVIGTTGDPATPYEYARAMASQLDSGVLLTLKGEGHLAYGQSACIKEKVDAYLVRGVVPKDGTRC